MIQNSATTPDRGQTLARGARVCSRHPLPAAPTCEPARQILDNVAAVKNTYFNQWKL